jgi:hypothetical protein
MATTVCLPAGYIKIEDTPSPEPIYIPIDDPVISNTPVPVVESAPLIDPRDPEGFLKRCSGFNKSKRIKERCSAVIGKKSEQNCHPTFLPTCRAHRDQQSFAGWCQYQRADGERCGRLFRWTPPYFELCSDHQGHPDTPCYYFRLPLELRHEVLRYLLPTRPIGSSTAALHDGILDAFDSQHVQPVPRTGSFRSNNQRHHHGITPTHCHHEIPDSLFPMPALDLFLVNRQFYLEAKDLLFSTVPFTIDVRKDGTFMCGRRLLEPRRADGSSHFLVDDADEAKQRFLRYFDWAAVKHYVVDVLVENGSNGDVGLGRGVHNGWDEEVEVYDIRGQSFQPLSYSVSFCFVYSFFIVNINSKGAITHSRNGRLHLRRSLRRPFQIAYSRQTPSPPVSRRLRLVTHHYSTERQDSPRTLRIATQCPPAADRRN